MKSSSKPKLALFTVLILLLSLVLFTTLKPEPATPTAETQPPAKTLADLTQIPTDPDGLIQLPLRVRLITDLTLQKKGVSMSTWVSADEFREHILPEINRIWKPAKIQWVAESIQEQPAAELTDQAKAISYLESAKRSTPEKSYSERIPIIRKFCRTSYGHPVIHTLYLFPYMGETSQGVATLGGNWAISGVWTDKPFRGQKPPIKFQLKEEGSFQIGSIARTCSHELGHNLSLQHPNKPTQTRFNRLMGGKKHGYTLTAEEIKQARAVALTRAQSILDWNAKQSALETTQAE